MLLNRPQEWHCDLGLVDDDFTEDLRANRPGKSESPEVAASEDSEPLPIRK